MTAQVTYPDCGIIPEWALSAPAQYEQEDIGHIPGTLWERVADNCDVCGEHHPGEIRDSGNSFCIQSDRLALERAKAAHPAGKGITHEEVQQ